MTLVARLCIALALCTGGATARDAADTSPQWAAPARDCASSTPGALRLGTARLHYDRLGTGSLVVVMVHGGYGPTPAWRSAACELAREFTVIAVDSRGRGRSTLGDAPLTPGRLAEDLVRLLDALGLPRAAFVGHSEGAITVMALLIDYPERVTRAVLTGATYDRRLTRSADRAGEDAATLQDLSTPEVRRLHDAYVTQSGEPERYPEVAAALAAAWRVYPAFPREALATIKAPVLVVTARRDDYVPPSAFEALAGAIPRARTFDAGDATHAVWQDAAPALIPAVRAFLRGDTSGKD